MKKIVLLLLLLSLSNSNISISQFTQTNGPEGGIILSMASNNSYIALGTENGVYISNTNGQSWFQAGLNVFNVNYIDGISFQGNNIFAGSGNGVFFTSNNGVNWVQRHNHYTKAILVNGSTIFSGASVQGVYVSTNSGLNWTQANNGLPSTIQWILGFGVIGSNYYLAMNAHGIYMTTNYGSSWTLIYNNFPNLYSISSFISNGSLLFTSIRGSGIFRSTNGGLNWIAVNNGLTNLNTSCLHTNNNNLYVGTNNGLFKSTNNGDNWTFIGLYDNNIRCINEKSSIIFAGTQSGIYKSTNSGNNWTEANTNLYATRTNTLCPIFPFLLGGGWSFIQSTSNNGNTWLNRESGIGKNLVNVIYNNGSKLFAGIENTGVGIYFSTNNGLNWTLNNNGIGSHRIYSFTSYGQNVFAGSWNGGVFVSTNNGNSWTIRNSGLTSLIILSLVNKNNIVFAGTFDGVYLTLDNGINWAPSNSGLTNLSVRGLGFRSDDLFAATQGGGMFKSTNNAISWTAVNNGITDLTLYSMYTSKNCIITCNYTNYSGIPGVYISTNNGSSWTNINQGLPSISTVIMSVTTDIGYVYVGTKSSGVWKRPLSGFVIIPPPPLQVYPPNNSTNIPLNVTLDWDSNNTVLSYNIQISTSPSFTSYVLDTSGIITSYFTVPQGKLNVGVTYYWRIRGGNEGGYSGYSQVWSFTTSTTNIKIINSEIPDDFYLGNNYPNPFNPVTKIKFAIPTNELVTLKIYDILGKEVAILLNEKLSAGSYEVNWDASEYPSGVFFYRLITNKFDNVRKMILYK